MTTNISNNPILINQSLWAAMLVTPTPSFIAKLAAEQTSIPENAGNQQLLVRPQQLPPAITAIPAGSLGPPPVILQRNIVSIDLALYGQSIWFDRRLLEQDQMPWLAVGTERLGIALRDGEDLLIYNALSSSAVQYACYQGAIIDTPTSISSPDINNLYSILQTANSPTTTRIIVGDLRFGTSPVISSYWMLCNTRMTATLQAVTNFQFSAQYPDPAQSQGPNEYGTIPGFRIWISSNCPISSQASKLSQDVYSSFCGGGNPYAEVTLDANSTRLIYRDDSYSGPLGLQVSLGSTMFFGCGITQPTWIINVQSVANYFNIF
jgi:N4-gp56 family major capsid protein